MLISIRKLLKVPPRMWHLTEIQREWGSEYAVAQELAPQRFGQASTQVLFKLQQGGETNWAQWTRGGFQEIRSKKVLESAQPGCLDYFIMLAFTLRSKRSNGVVGGFTLGEYPGLTYTFMGTLCGLY